MKSLNTVQKAFLALIIANLIWGAAAPIFKLSLQNIPPFTLAFWRFFLGSFILLAILGKRARIPTVDRKGLFALIAYALTGITINIIFFFWGLRLTLAINSPIISTGQPILTAIFAFLFLRERFSFKKILGILAGAGGILIIVIQPLMETGVDGSFIGNIFLVIAATAAVLQTIIGRAVMKKFDPLAFTFWAFVIGWASFLPLMISEYVAQPSLYTLLDWRGYLGIAYGAVFSSAAGYSLYAWALTKISATDTSLFTYIDPVAGVILGALLLHEPITPPFLLGSVLIFSGIFIAEGHIHYHPVRKFFILGQPIDSIPVPRLNDSIETKTVKKLDKKKVLASIFHK